MVLSLLLELLVIGGVPPIKLGVVGGVPGLKVEVNLLTSGLPRNAIIIIYLYSVLSSFNSFNNK
jgi:hypothetical protein